jgi:hypothetical protein
VYRLYPQSFGRSAAKATVTEFPLADQLVGLAKLGPSAQDEEAERYEALDRAGDRTMTSGYEE